MKKKIIISIIVVITLVLLVPIKNKLKDGGTIEYNAILYQVTKYHSLVEDSSNGYIDGTKIKVFGTEIYNNLKKTDKTSEIKTEVKENERIVKIGDKLYYENKNAEYSATCGTMDAYIKTHVNPDEIPTNNLEANFEEAGGFQRVGENSIALRLDEGWVVFEASK